MKQLLLDSFRPPPPQERRRLRRSAVFWLVTGTLLPIPFALATGRMEMHRLLPSPVYLAYYLLFNGAFAVFAIVGMHRLLWGHPDSRQTLSPGVRGTLSTAAVLLLLYPLGFAIRLVFEDILN